jgi:hypothetical protein
MREPSLPRWDSTKCKALKRGVACNGCENSQLELYVLGGDLLRGGRCHID